MSYMPQTQIVSSSKTLTGNNTTVATAVFTITGVVEVLRIWGVVTTVLGSNVTAAAYRLNDSTAQSDITLSTGSTLSSFSVGSAFYKRGLSTTALTIVSASQERVNDPSAANTPEFTSVILTQKTGSVTTNIEFVYATTNTPTSGAIQHFVEWRPLSAGSTLTAV